MVKISDEGKTAPAQGVEINDYILTKEQLATKLHVSVRTVENWMQQKLVPYVKPTKSVRFIWPDVEQALRRNFGVGYLVGTTSSSSR